MRYCVRAEVLVVPRLNGQSIAVAKDGAADGVAKAEDSMAGGLYSEDKGWHSGQYYRCRGQCGGRPVQQGQKTAQRTVLWKERIVRQITYIVGTKDGAADGTAEPEDSAVDGLQSGDEGRCTRRYYGRKGQCSRWPAHHGQRMALQMVWHKQSTVWRMTFMMRTKDSAVNSLYNRGK